MVLAKESAGETFSRSFRDRMFTLDRYIKLELERLTSGESTAFNRINLLTPRDIARLTEAQRRKIGIIPEAVKFQPWADARARRTAQDHIRKQVDDYQKHVDTFANKDLRDIYLAGAQSVKPTATLTRTQKAQATKLALKTHGYLNHAMNQVRSKAGLVRTLKANNARSFNAKIRQAGKVTIRGRDYDFNKYTELVATTEAQRAFNYGIVDEAVKADTKYFEVVDGPECGWRHHDDEEKANGKVVTSSEAKAYPLAHPNCVRRFIPRPDLKSKREATRAQKDLQASKIEKLARQVGRAAAQALAKEAIDVGAQLAFQLLTDQQFREMTFNTYENGLVRLSQFTDRIHRWRTDAAARLLGVVPTEQEIVEGTSNWIEEFMKDEAAAQRNMPEYAYGILTGQKATYLRRFKGQLPKAVGDRIMTQADDFAEFVDIRERATMTHQELNIRNSIESEFGSEFFKNMARTFGSDNNLLNIIQELSQTFATRYAPNAGNVKTATGWIKQDSGLGSKIKNQIRGEAYRHFIKSRVDDTLAHMPTLTEDGRWTVIGNVLNLNRKDLLGIKYNYSKRLIGVQMDLIDKWRYYPTARLRQIALARGVPPNRIADFAKEVVMPDGTVKRTFDRQALIGSIRGQRGSEMARRGIEDPSFARSFVDYFASNFGMLSHITLNRNGLVRMGFNFSPYYGWRRPIPRITIQPRTAVFGLRPKISTTLNRGILMGPGVRAAVAAGDMTVEGMRLRSATTELSVALGRTILRPRGIVKFLGSTVQGPGVVATGIRLNTEIGKLHNWTDLKSFIKNAEVIGTRYLGATNSAQAIFRGIQAKTGILSLFMEMRLMGWRWLRLGRIVGLSASQSRDFVRSAGKVWGNFSAEARLGTIESYIRDYYRGVFKLAPETFDLLVRHYVRMWEIIKLGHTTEGGSALGGAISFEDRVQIFKDSFAQVYGGRVSTRLRRV